MKNVYLLIFLFLLLSVPIGLMAQNNKIAKKLTKSAVLSIDASVEKAATCIDSEDGVISVRINGGQAPYQIIELRGIEKRERLAHGFLFTKLDPGVYTISVIDALGQEINTQLTLDVINPEPFADFEVAVKKEALQLINTSDQIGRWEWTFENGTISHEASPVVPLTKKAQQVCLKVSNGCNHTDTYCETIYVDNLLATNNPINNQASSNTETQLIKARKDYHIKAYPNPTVDRLTIRYAEQAQVQSIELYNVAGKLLESFSPQTTTQTKVSIGKYPVGMYLMKVSGITTRTFRVNRVK